MQHPFTRKSLLLIAVGILCSIFACPLTEAATFASPQVSDSEATVDTKPTAEERTKDMTENAGSTPEETESYSEERRNRLGDPLISNDAVTFGILMIILGFIFWSSSIDFKPFKIFYTIIPMLLMCYFLPSLLTFFWIIDHEESNLYFVASRYLLPASLILLTLSIDLGGIIGLGPKAIIMFLVGTAGVVIGGPLAILLISFVQPEWVGGQSPNEVWRGLTTVAGSWIGGGANQVAMKEVFEVSDAQYSAMVTVDVLVAEFWMLFLLLGVAKSKSIDRFFGADASSIDRLQNKMEKFSLSIARPASATDLMVIGAICFGGVGLAHFGADLLAPMFEKMSEDLPWIKSLGLHKGFFWLVVISTTLGVVLSFTRLRNYEGAGASKLGTVFIFILVAVIGTKMDITAVVKYKELFIVGLVWMLIHVGLLFLTAWLIRAPYFFLAVGSKANIGGAASAPVVAAAFHPSLAPVGVLLAVLGYALGTYGAMLCGYLMKAVAPEVTP